MGFSSQHMDSIPGISFKSALFLKSITILPKFGEKLILFTFTSVMSNLELELLGGIGLAVHEVHIFSE